MLVKKKLLLIILVVFMRTSSIPSTIAAKKNLKIWVECILQRHQLLYVNPEYAIAYPGTITRANRTSPYALSFNVTFLKPIYNNVTVESRTYQKWTNVYKPSLIDLHIKACDYIKSWLYFPLKNYSNFPNKCPVVGTFWVKDMNIDFNMMPFYNPQMTVTHWRLDSNLYQNVEKVYMVKWRMFLKLVTRVGVKPGTMSRQNVKEYKDDQ